MSKRKPAHKPTYAVHLLSMPDGRHSWDDIETTTTYHSSTASTAARLATILGGSNLDEVAIDAGTEARIEAIVDAMCDGLDRGFGSEPMCWTRHGRVFRLEVGIVTVDAKPKTPTVPDSVWTAIDAYLAAAKACDASCTQTALRRMDRTSAKLRAALEAWDALGGDIAEFEVDPETDEPDTVVEVCYAEGQAIVRLDAKARTAAWR